MSLPTPSQSVLHKGFHQWMNHEKKLSLRHFLPTFGSFSFFQASIWLEVDNVLKKWTKSCKIELKHLFQSCILIPRKCPRKPPFNTQCPVIDRITLWQTSARHVTVQPNRLLLPIFSSYLTRIGKNYFQGKEYLVVNEWLLLGNRNVKSEHTNYSEIKYRHIYIQDLILL